MSAEPPISVASGSHAHAVLAILKVERGLRRRKLAVNLPTLPAPSRTMFSTLYIIFVALILSKREIKLW